jgi:tetratricopeptide (TPR) repeat protein
MAGKTLHLWGADEISARLVDELVFDDKAVRRLSSYLPDFARVHDEEASSHLVPAPDRRQLVRADVDAELARRLESQACLTISGVAGLGKSAAAAAFAIHHADDFNLVIWLDADEVRRPEDLRAIPLLRGGEPRNIVSLLQTRACLLVIDDAHPNLPDDVLAKFCGLKSRVLLTRRISSPASYELPFFSNAEAKSILNDAAMPCPPETFEVIWSAIGGHPLTLGLMSAAVRQGASWADIAEDCQTVSNLDDHGQPLADRLLGRLRRSLERELSVFVWAGQPVCGGDFLEQVIQPHGVRKLRSNCLTAFDRSGVIRLHDVVHASLGADWCVSDRRTQLDAALESYLISVASEPGLRFWATARSLRSKIEDLVASGSPNAAFRYALLMAWDAAELRPELVGDPSADAALIEPTPAPLAVMAVIEAIEQLFLHEKLEGQAVAESRLRERLEIFDRLASLPGLTPLEATQIKHHKAKAFKRLGQRVEASALFEDVLNGPLSMDEARLQLIDLYKGDRSKEERSVELVNEIMGSVVAGRHVVYSVLLGVVERLPRGPAKWRDDLIIRHADAIERTIIEAADVGVQQAFIAFSAFGRYISKEHPALFARIFRRLPEQPLDSLQTDNERFAWAEILCEASRLPNVNADHLRERALELYAAEIKPQLFHLQRRAELLIDMQRPDDAEVLLRARDDLETSGWIQRLMARARFAQGAPGEALDWIDKALARLDNEHFRSEFLELRFDIRVARGDRDAIDDLEKARIASLKEVEGARLDARLRNLANRVERKPISG